MRAQESNKENELINLAFEMSEILIECEEDNETYRNLPKTFARELSLLGFFNICTPESYGGAAISPLGYAKIIESLARSNASSAWCSFISTSAAFCLAAGGGESIKKLLSVPGVIVAGVFAPQGIAIPCRESGVSGYRVSGEWSWGSGTQNADWITGGCVILEDDLASLGVTGPQIRHMIFPYEQVTVIDDWHVMGLKGTGSSGFKVDDVFVPHDHSVLFQTSFDKKEVVFNFPIFGILSIGIASVALGIANSAVEESISAVSESRSVTGKKLVDCSTVQIKLARVTARLLAAHAFFHGEITSAWNAAQLGTVSVGQRANLRLSIVHAVEAAKEAITAAYDIAGGAALYQESRLQRDFRDIHAISKHIMIGEETLEALGKLILSVPTQTNFL